MTKKRSRSGRREVTLIGSSVTDSVTRRDRDLSWYGDLPQEDTPTPPTTRFVQTEMER